MHDRHLLLIMAGHYFKTVVRTRHEDEYPLPPTVTAHFDAVVEYLPSNGIIKIRQELKTIEFEKTITTPMMKLWLDGSWYYPAELRRKLIEEDDKFFRSIMEKTQ